MGSNWSREEVEATVADYFSMLELELAGKPLNKSVHRHKLKQLLNNRTDRSVDYKHCNISATLVALNFPYIIKGYKPLSNYQGLLFDVVSERLSNSYEIAKLVEVKEEQPIFVPKVDDILKVLTKAPQLKTASPRAKEEITEYIKRSPVNYIEMEVKNQRLGLAGEEFILNYEQARLLSLGKEKLASKIEHVSKKYGDGEGYDVLSFEASGEERLIEVKTTKYGAGTPFFVTQNELQVSERKTNQYQLYRLYSFRDDPHLFTLPGALSDTCVLNPVSYVASVDK